MYRHTCMSTHMSTHNILDRLHNSLRRLLELWTPSFFSLLSFWSSQPGGCSLQCESFQESGEGVASSLPAGIQHWSGVWTRIEGYKKQAVRTSFWWREQTPLFSNAHSESGLGLVRSWVTNWGKQCQAAEAGFGPCGRILAVVVPMW